MEGLQSQDINELTNGEANAESNISDGIHPSIDSTAEKFMSKLEA